MAKQKEIKTNAMRILEPMKKQYVTRIDASAQTLPTMIVSGGRIGSQIELVPDDLLKAARAEYAEIIKQ